MHHSHAAHRSAGRPHAAVTTAAGSRSPLGELDQAFLALARRADPLTLPAHLVSDELGQEAWPVDQVRARLAHPSTRGGLRAGTWSEVVRRAHTLGEPWSVVALGMAVPALRRILARQVRPAHLERAEIEQEALAALAVALHTADAGQADVDRELFRAADRAVHRLVYASRRNAVRESGDAVHLGRLHAPESAGCGEAAEDEYTVLARAVQARVLNVPEAQLIARTRLGGEPMHCLAVERRVSVRQLYRHRAAAEQYLATYLRRQLHDEQ